jgi:RNA polymerase sigma factor (sigma-70 family)
MLANRLRRQLRRALNPRSDHGRPGDAELFRPQRHLGWGRERPGDAELFRPQRGQGREPRWRSALQEDLRHEAVRDAVMDLPEQEKAVVQLRYWAGLKMEEIAGRLGVGLRTAERRHADALAFLEQKLAA